MTHAWTRVCRWTFVVCTSVVPPGRDALAQTIAPKFAWPRSAVAEITVTGSTVVHTAIQNDSSSYHATNRLVVQPDPAGLLITSGPMALVDGRMAPGGASAGDAMTRLITSYTVSTEGKYGALSDTARLRQRIDSAAAPLLQQMSALPENMRSGMAAAFSVTSIDRGASRSWWNLAGVVVSQRWSRGDSSVLEYSDALPMLPGAKIKYHNVTQFDGVAECPAEAGGGSCWRFSTRVEMDLLSMRAAIGEMLQNMGVSDPSMIDNIPVPKTTISTVSLFDPKTSRPVSTETRTSTESAGMPNLGVPGTSTYFDSRQVYVWKAR